MGVDFSVWDPWRGVAFLGPQPWEIVLLVAYILVSFFLLYRQREDFRRLGWQRWLLLLALLFSPLITNHLVVLSFSRTGLLPPPGIPVPPYRPAAALLGAVPIFVAGAWLGGGPALLVGLVIGVLRAGMANSGVLDVFYSVLFAYLVGFHLRQDYRGWFPLIMRQPVVAGIWSVLLASALQLLSVLAQAASSGVAALDYAVTTTQARIGPALLESLVASLLLQAVYLAAPVQRPVRAVRRYPPYSRTLSRRLLFIFLPLVLLTTFVLVYAVTTTTLDMAVAYSVDEMARDASSAAEDIPYFIRNGQAFLDDLAQDEALRSDDAAVRVGRLQSGLRKSAFFSQLLLYDLSGELVTAYPSQPSGEEDELTEHEAALLQRVLDTGAPQISEVHRGGQGEVRVSFLGPVENAETGARSGALVGRTQLDTNLILRRALATLELTSERSVSFFVDSDGQVVVHSDPSLLLTNWYVSDDRQCMDFEVLGCAYESLNQGDNTRELVYHLPVDGYPWEVVIRLPYDVVLEQATQIARPLLVLQILLGGALVLIIPLTTRIVIRPLTELAEAAARIAKGDLSGEIRVPGDDEVARVGVAFEGMRVRLKNRLEDLSLLLQVSQAVSATLELPEGMPHILEGLLKATNAQVARIVFLSADGEPQMVMGRGTARAGLGPLDRTLAAAARDMESPLVIGNLARARTLADAQTLQGPVRAVIALPVRSKGRVLAVMWVGYETARSFESSEVDLLSTLASQTAVLVENARLFQSAEGGRRRLAAILASTSDAVLVTDRDDQILLVNPAAERAFGLAADAVIGHKVSEAGLEPVLARVFKEPLSSADSEALTEEVPLPDGHILYASVSAILSADGERLGRVAVMRDITHFKELDELKSEFVATVSHDLRAPLTFMRGYATMLPMVGELGEQQSEYVEKILQGVSQMNVLIDDLLDLGRIEAGVGLERKPCHLGAIVVEAVDGMRVRAAAKGITLHLESTAGVAVIAGDAALLRQSVTNLVENAIKYTPSEGSISVGLAVRNNQAIIRVTDTGIGIAPDDQVRLFEKFYRVKRRDIASVEGTGLGLAIVKSIVERHDGRVWVDSELGKGSTFYISLPIDRAEVAELEARA